jgi:hypothetical protein
MQSSIRLMENGKQKIPAREPLDSAPLTRLKRFSAVFQENPRDFPLI